MTKNRKAPQDMYRKVFKNFNIWETSLTKYIILIILTAILIMGLNNVYAKSPNERLNDVEDRITNLEERLVTLEQEDESTFENLQEIKGDILTIQAKLNERK